MRANDFKPCIKRFNAKWLKVNQKPTLRIEFSSDQCGLDIPFIALADYEHLEVIEDPPIHFYTFEQFEAKVDRRSKISPGVIGNFDLNYKGQILSAKTEWSGKQLQQKMAAVFGSEFSAAAVSKSGECKSGYTYHVTWNTAGDKEQIELEHVAVTGLAVKAQTMTMNDGGILVPFISYRVRNPWFA